MLTPHFPESFPLLVLLLWVCSTFNLAVLAKPSLFFDLDSDSSSSALDTLDTSSHTLAKRSRNFYAHCIRDGWLAMCTTYHDLYCDNTGQIHTIWTDCETYCTCVRVPPRRCYTHKLRPFDCYSDRSPMVGVISGPSENEDELAPALPTGDEASQLPENEVSLTVAAVDPVVTYDACDCSMVPCIGDGPAPYSTTVSAITDAWPTF